MFVPVWTLHLSRDARPLSQERVKKIMGSPGILNDPIRVNTDGVVVDGYHRLQARISLGLLYVECLLATEEDIDTMK